MSNDKNKHADLINELAGDLQPVACMMHPFLRALVWFVLALGYVLGVAYFGGVRPDLARMLDNEMFVFEIVLTSAISISAILATAWMCVPDMREQSWLVAVPFTLLAVFVAWVVLTALEQGALDKMPDMHMHGCVLDGVLMCVVPVFLSVMMVRRGATTRPILGNVLSILSAAALGFTALRFTCMNDMLDHIAISHVLPYVVIGSIFGLIAQRFYRW